MVSINIELTAFIGLSYNYKLFLAECMLRQAPKLHFPLPKLYNLQFQVNFTFKSNKYNQYVQTHMSWNEEKFLTKQQIPQIPTRILPAPLNEVKQQQLKKISANPKLIKMPIPKFQLDKMNDIDIDDNQDLITSIGVAKENSFLISSQLTTLPFKLNSISAQTQTDDFTFVNNLFIEPKIYEIPVQMELQESLNYQQQGVQVSHILLSQFLQKIQQNNPAALTKHQLQMNSGVLSMSIQNYSFERDQQLNQKTGSVFSNNQNDNNSEEIEQEEQLLLQNEIESENKQNLFKTAIFQHHFTNRGFYGSFTPQKSGISGQQSSPETNGLMRMSQREVNMMQTKQMPIARIDEEQYEEFQRRFYLLQQQNAEKFDHIEVLNSRIQQLMKELNKLQQVTQEKVVLQQICKQLEKQVEHKNAQLQKVSHNLYQTKQELMQFQENNHNKSLQIEDILEAKQNQLRQLQKQINEYRSQMTSGQQKYTKENQALQNLINEKQQQINEIKSEHDRKYQLYIISIKEMKQKIQHNQLKMENMENALNDRDLKISEYKEEYLKLRQENSILYKRIENMKEQFSRASSSLSSSLKNQQQNKPSPHHNAHFPTINNGSLKDLQSRQSTKNYQLSLPSTKVSRQVLQKKKTNYNSSHIIMEQEKQSQQKANPLQNSNDPQPEQSQTSETMMKQQQGTISISESNRFSKFPSYSFQKPSHINHNDNDNSFQQKEYSKQLERIVLIYEDLIETQLETIEELEEKVLEFLKDGLVKESQAQLLYSQLCQYENSLNGLMVEKLDMELENQRLKKMITDSENKLSVLGSRLIRLAKNNSSINSRGNQQRNPSSSSSIEDPSVKYIQQAFGMKKQA